MAYTEFYCQNGGSNLNSGSTTNNTATYTSTAGNWVQATRVFTPTDGSTPANTVSAGDWVSVYLNAATVGTYIGRISAVGAGVNGTITVDATATAGAAPSNSTGGITVKVGGACQGPNGGSQYPLLSGHGALKNVAGNMPRFNFKNDQTYSISTGITSNQTCVLQGYSSSVGDTGRATIDTSTNAIKALAMSGGSSQVSNLIFVTTATTGTSDLASEASNGVWFNCVFHGSRGSGLVLAGVNASATECEAYDNNKSNTAGKAGFSLSLSQAVAACYRCNAHDNTGSNTAGFQISNSGAVLSNCIADTNGGKGIFVSSGGTATNCRIQNCDIYNNGSDGIAASTTTITVTFFIENSNLIKNTGAGINITSSTGFYNGYIFNCGYGAGTQANGSADTIGDLVQSGTVTYASNVTPWVDPANGDFRITLSSAKNAGRGAFAETAASYAGTIAYPDIGAAQHLDSGGASTQKAYTFGG